MRTLSSHNGAGRFSRAASSRARSGAQPRLQLLGRDLERLGLLGPGARLVEDVPPSLEIRLARQAVDLRRRASASGPSPSTAFTSSRRPDVIRPFLALGLGVEGRVEAPSGAVMLRSTNANVASASSRQRGSLVISKAARWTEASWALS